MFLKSNQYGKTRVRIMKVERHREPHRVTDLSVDIKLRGDFEAAHVDGDNSNIVATDTMKNTVYALGKDHALASIESFAQHLAEHFVSRYEQVHAARVVIVEKPWSHVQMGEATAPTTFVQQENERKTCDVQVDSRGVDVSSGLTDLVVLKTLNSGFSEFFRDAFTTLPELDDRLLGTSISAHWKYRTSSPDYGQCRQQIRDALLRAFSEHHSRSVQETLYAMGELALVQCHALQEISLVLPNQHCLLVDLSPFGKTNDNEIFVPIDEPAGLIEAVVARDE